MNDRFRTSIYGMGGKFKMFIFWGAVYGAPAITCCEGYMFKEHEQCTGMKDKNGNLIYEGDIVLNGFHNNLIEWFKGGFWINGFVNGAKWNIHITHDSLEVIGNVHENPELLEKKNENK